MRAWLWLLQVVPSFVSDATLSFAWGDQIAKADAKEQWLQRARGWVRKRAGECDQGSREPPKKQRKKASTWIACVDQILRKCCSTGLDFWRVPREQWWTRDPFSWPYLAITPDQGPDGVSGLYFLRYGESINLDVFWDLSHGVWRDQEGSVRQVQHEAWSHLMVVTWNLAHSPWNSEARFCALRESSEEYLATANELCPLFRRPPTSARTASW